MFGFNRKKKEGAADNKKDAEHPPSSHSTKRSFLSLEQRLMFDAAASATASEVASEQVAQEQAEAAVSSENHADGPSAEQTESQGLLDAIAAYNPGESRSEVVFVDQTVPNYQDLLSGMDPNIEVIMLDGGQDGIEQMANALSDRTGIDAIHVISHGGAGELQLGTGVLNADSMSTQYANDLAVIQQSLSEQADILVYGCEFAQGDAGQAAVDMLAELTGADVQASSDLTGCISLGGDWEFEVSTGAIETSLAISYDAQMNWAEVLGNETVADTFSDKSFSNNDGTRSWSSTWAEVDRGGSGADGGHIKINSGELRIEAQMTGASVSRGVDLSGARSATLSFDYENDLDRSGSVEVRISTDGGANYRTLADGTFSRTTHTGSGTASFNISDYMSADTKIQFVVTGTSGGDRLFIDNVQVDYNVADANTAPTDLALSGNTVAEQAATGTVVGTVRATDPDAGETQTYRLTDTAGGRFAIDPSTGEITVADGSLLNYEAAASHSVTVQVTDRGGQSYTEQFTITLSNVNEGPSDLQKGSRGGPSLLHSNQPPGFEGNAKPAVFSQMEVDTSDGAGRVPDDLRKPGEWSSHPGLKPDIPSSGRNLSNVALEGEWTLPGRSTGDGNLSPLVGQHEDTTVTLDLVNQADAEVGQVSWLPSEEVETVPEDPSSLSMPMALGLVGAVLQGSLGKKERITILNTPGPARGQQPAHEQNSQQPSEDKKETPSSQH